jgi:dethiobiotin synthetase
MKGFFVTGTDTGVGKTVASAYLLKQLRRTKSVCYWKPVQTGIEEDNDTETVRTLAECADSEIFDQGFRLEKPLSPHLSARLANVQISIGKILQFLEKADREQFFIVEGAGGVLVPLNEYEMMIDLMKALNLPVIVVARSGLGTINHTCLTLEMLQNRGLEVFGVIMNGEPNSENRQAIEYYGNTRVLAEIPLFQNIEMDFRPFSDIHKQDLAADKDR